MQTAERQIREKIARKEFILDQAESIIFARGFKNTTTEEIARQAGYTKRSLYFYFKDREEIFYSIVYRGQKILISYLLQASEEFSENRSRSIFLFANAFYNFSIEYPEYFSLIMTYEANRHIYTTGKIDTSVNDEPSAKGLCQNLSIDCGNLLEKALEYEIRNNTIKTDLEAKQLMMLLWGSTFGVMQILLMRKDKFEETYSLSPQSFFATYLAGLEKAYYT